MQRLRLELDRGVATLWLARPEKSNALDESFWRELPDAFAALGADPAVRAIVLAAEGRHFCAGLDLGIFAGLRCPEGGDPARHAEALRATIIRLQAALTAIEQCRKPVLAAVQGACVGAGLAMALCADMCFCTGDAHFSVAEIDLAIAADLGTLQRLPRRVPPGLARELAYSGRRLGAEEAVASGLCNRAFGDSESMLEGVAELARQIAAKSPLAVRTSKEMLNHACSHSVEEGLRYAAALNAAAISSREVQASFEARLQGRDAEFEG